MPALLQAYESQAPQWERERQQVTSRLAQMESIPDPTDREIGRLLHKQELAAADQRRAEQLKAIVDQAPDALETNDRVRAAFERARQQGTPSALMALDREIKRMLEDEDFMVLALMVN